MNHLFQEFNKFNIRLTEQLWHLDSDNKSGFFSKDNWLVHTGMHQAAKEGNIQDIQGSVMTFLDFRSQAYETL